MPGEIEPTPWELHRADKQILESLTRIEISMMTGKQFEEYRAAADGRLSDVRGRQAGWETLSGAEHVAIRARISAGEKDLDTKIEKQAERADTLERSARESRTRTLLAIGLAVLGALLSIGVTVILRGVGS